MLFLPHALIQLYLLSKYMYIVRWLEVIRLALICQTRLLNKHAYFFETHFLFSEQIFLFIKYMQIWIEVQIFCLDCSLISFCKRNTVFPQSSYSFRGNYSFLNLEIQRSQYIRLKVTVHKCAETIQGRKLYEEIL